ncbi:DUF7344 domain-containing protein [Halorussus pelagicus]|uniref:DUF7344 domain-containing protein n=1 Tax=Halorussus pelagicus TaxID=2505977 RepID=UPI000FFB7CB6|nr:hypothetical protein [Halorussus pelagicus]
MESETAFDLLSNEYRRAIVALLDERGSVPREQLPSLLLPRDGSDEDDETDRRQLRIALHHNHLPRLVDAGVVADDGETVIATEKLAFVASLLDESEWGFPSVQTDLNEQIMAFYA